MNVIELQNQEPMSEAAYRAYPAINYSTLKHARKSLLHYRAAVDAPPDHALSQKLAVFSAVHARVLEPYSFDSMFAVYDGRKDARTKAYKAFLEENPGKLVLSPKELEQCDAIAEAVLEHPWVAELLADENTFCEQVAVWNDHDAGPCKAKMDVTHLSQARGLLSVDLKSFGGTDPDFIAREGARRGWPLQHAHYLHASAAYWGVDLSKTRYRALNIVVEANDPHDVIVTEWSDETMDAAMAEHRGLLMRVAEAQATGLWTGRHHTPDRPVVITPPSYLL